MTDEKFTLKENIDFQIRDGLVLLEKDENGNFTMSITQLVYFVYREARKIKSLLLMGVFLLFSMLMLVLVAIIAYFSGGI